MKIDENSVSGASLNNNYIFIFAFSISQNNFKWIIDRDGGKIGLSVVEVEVNPTPYITDEHGKWYSQAHGSPQGCIKWNLLCICVSKEKRKSSQGIRKPPHTHKAVDYSERNNKTNKVRRGQLCVHTSFAFLYTVHTHTYVPVCPLPCATKWNYFAAVCGEWRRAQEWHANGKYLLDEINSIAMDISCLHRTRAYFI